MSSDNANEDSSTKPAASEPPEAAKTTTTGGEDAVATTNDNDDDKTPTHRKVLVETCNYSLQHPNDFGIPDGRDRIPMKKLMKLFGIKKKSPPETQNLFRAIVNDLCDLEFIEGIGKVLVLKEDIDTETAYPSDGDGGEPTKDYGYGEAAPSVAAAAEAAGAREPPSPRERRREAPVDRTVPMPPTVSPTSSLRDEARFRPPTKTGSGRLSVATADSFGVYEDSSEADPGGDAPGTVSIRKTGYRRRGSVTRYSIVAMDAVGAEHREHESIIDRFRQDSLKIEHSMKSLHMSNSFSNTSNHNSSNSSGNNNSSSGNTAAAATTTTTT
mmetsp:Transcript_31440/g.65968  ORF Transcript_31440/g.65968 Transcript_31440/m.65968 type:complete len:327 (+) Transcript_31440:2530-3510(+)